MNREPFAVKVMTACDLIYQINFWWLMCAQLKGGDTNANVYFVFIVFVFISKWHRYCMTAHCLIVPVKFLEQNKII